MTPQQLDALLSVIGGSCETDSDWLDIAMACLDQAGMSTADQAKIERLASDAIARADECRMARAERLAEYAATDGAS